MQLSLDQYLAHVYPTSIGVGAVGVILFFIILAISQSPPQGKRIPTAWFYDHGIKSLATKIIPDFSGVQEKYGPAYRVRFFTESMIWVGGYPNARQVLNGENDIVSACWPPAFKKLIGTQALVNMTGHEHDKLRRSMLVAFTPSAIRSYLPKLQELAETAVQRWASASSGKNNNNDGSSSSIKMYEEVRWFASRVGTDLLVGFDSEWTSPEGFAEISEIYKVWWNGIFNFLLDAPGTPFRRSMNAKKELDDRILASLKKLRASREQAKKQGKAVEQETAMGLLLDAVHEEGRPFTERELIDAAVSLLVGSLDTTSTQLLCIFRVLTTHPEIFQNLKKEQLKILSTHGEKITVDALREMKYTEGIIKESMRLESSSTSLFRRANKDFMLESGHFVRKGEKLTLSLTHVLKTDERWKNDDILLFKPERWATDAGNKAGAFIPFGGGPRMCLGWQLAMSEMKMLLAVIARGYSFEYLKPEEKWTNFPFAVPLEGMPMRFTRETSVDVVEEQEEKKGGEEE